MNKNNTVLKIDYRNDRYKIYNGSRITRNDLFKKNFFNYYASHIGNILLDFISVIPVVNFKYRIIFIHVELISVDILYNVSTVN
jgi:hypothetical protein